MKSLKDAKITIRDFTEADIIDQDKYLGQAGDEYLINMGVEPSAARNMSSRLRDANFLENAKKNICNI